MSARSITPNWAKILNVSEKTVRRLTADGRLRMIRTDAAARRREESNGPRLNAASPTFIKKGPTGLVSEPRQLYERRRDNLSLDALFRNYVADTP